jgi:hypothetical protein
MYSAPAGGKFVRRDQYRAATARVVDNAFFPHFASISAGAADAVAALPAAHPGEAV